MNILLLTGIYDVKPSSGGSYLMRAYVDELRRQGHRVLVYYFSSSDKDVRTAANEPDTWYLPDLRSQQEASRPSYSKVLSKIKQSVLGKSQTEPDKLKRYFERDFSWVGPAFLAALKDVAIDVVQVDFPWMMKLADHLPASIPRVYVSHEAQFVLYDRKGQKQEAARSLVYETALAAQYNAVLTLTEIEADAWRQAEPTLTVINSPMGVELPKNDVASAPSATKLVFLGSGKHKPNLDGIEYFITEVWPKIQSNHPNVKLHITGIYPDAFKARLKGYKDVVWAGFVDDLAEFLHGAISIVPIRLGSGIRVKILESMALGATVVSTPMATEGIAAKPDAEILLAPDAGSFANAVERLLNDPALYHSISTQAKAFVYQHYELGTTTQRRVAVLQGIIDAAKP